MNYYEFLESKKHTTGDYGFHANWIPDCAFPFQRHVISKAVQKGRMGLFLDTGLGKTLIQLAIAQNIVATKNKRVLILTPLAVAFQFIKEAEKIGIDDIEHSKDGKHTKKIVVCNYERMHHLDPNDFECVMLDECFSPDTKIQLYREGVLRAVDIKDCKAGDKVLNCTGVDAIKSVKRRKVPYAIRVKFNGKSVTSSPRHPYFTQRGWVPAKDLEPGDSIVATDKAMRVLRGKFSDNQKSPKKEEVLQSILLSEMEDEAAGAPGKSPQPGSCGEARSKQVEMASIGGRRKGGGEDSKSKSHGEPRDEGEGFGYVKSDEPPTFSAWGKWSRDDIASAINEGCTVRELDSGICHITGEATGGLPDKLQSRLSSLESESCDRAGWSLPLQQGAPGHKEGREAGYFGVESVEVLEQGCAELDRYRDESGALYFYDLEVERHPSFTINEGLVHNSSILKNFQGRTRDQIIAFIKRVKYRFLATATPSPNDFIELGNSSEALGYMGYMDMLGKFFKSNQNSSDSNSRNIGEKFYLKPHAERDFFSWINQWSIMVKRPSDLGYRNEGYDLPPLHVNKHMVYNEKQWCIGGQTALFAMPAKTMTEVREEQKLTVAERCEKAAELALGKTSVYWCNRNDEGDLLAELDSEAVQITGGMSIDKKEDILLAFADGDIKRLITKARITGMGLNWQHCNHTVYFPTWSYEQYYQAVRRFWRFGQEREVTCDMVISEGQERVMEALQQKTQKAIELYENLVANANRDFSYATKPFDKKVQLPEFMR